MDVRLNLINRTTDFNGGLVIFQKNAAAAFGELAVAWQVIPDLGVGNSRSFTFPMSMKIAASDSYNNYTPQQDATNGQLFKLALTSSGDYLQSAGMASSPGQVQVLNALERGAFSVSIYKDGKLLAVETAISPQQKAIFEFKPSIWIGIINQVTQGEIMNSDVVSNINTELSLSDLTSADIAMTGNSKDGYKFGLENIVKY